MAVKLLIAEDSIDVAEVISFGARMAWPDCQVRIAGTGEDALRYFNEEPADVVVLDINMPAPNGFEVCARLRKISNVPILILTAHDSQPDKIRGFDQGADDYMTKPFDHFELLARLRALVRRSTGPLLASALSFTTGELTVDYTLREAKMGGERIYLTTIEYQLLEALVRHAGAPLSHRYLLEQVWGPEYVSDTHYLKVFIRRLRQKLGDDSDNPRYIQTERGLGYRFIPTQKAAPSPTTPPTAPQYYIDPSGTYSTAP